MSEFVHYQAEHPGEPSDGELLALARAEIEELRAALAQPPAPTAQPARTLLEQYDLDQSPEYRKGYEDGRLKGFEVGQRYARETAQPAARCPLCRYQHGHQIGCENNPVDIALKAAQKGEKL